ncbi:GAF and ANTAR domain-containing protein [Amycolatopsis acidiphila]|uniref:GAF and ANTAR domain-containing protein n=1 Tax=Amycolatopsis acidiphila TaxID=715473 RepID=A0A557ZUS5_9PSEU|nr:GAF and ANTAR domain-containing protein [Amycolatopsis acidiphila]TVT15767.1 GAF and ANTAR domain-containing protein [Amycolatopsis acidiphila]UIJ56843.1 GAF and ANTAR domain-containing protein [Amycolatopsis acidiphila]GHG54823.1 transcriptional regulator [Amycolatopsis acidiphila]
MTERVAPPRDNPEESELGIAAALGSVVRTLEAEPDVDSTVEHIVTAVVSAVPGTEDAGVSLLEQGRMRSVAPTSEVVAKLDLLQHELRQGPCVDAVFDDPAYRTGDLATDPRWPDFAAAATKLGIVSMLGVRLFTSSTNLGALNLYSTKPQAFDAEAEQVTGLFAAHAAVALAGSRRQEQLREALRTRDTISTAKGILMQRHKVGHDEAFHLLVKVSQRSNRKLHEVASWLVQEVSQGRD